MAGIVTELLRLESAKKDALIEGNAPAYDEHVCAQLCLLDSATDLEHSARQAPGDLASLARLTRINTALYLNLVATSPLFALSQLGYTSTGNIETSVGGRVAVEG